MKEVIDALQAYVTRQEQEDAKHEAHILTLVAKVSELESRIAEYETRIEELEGRIIELEDSQCEVELVLPEMEEQPISEVEEQPLPEAEEQTVSEIEEQLSDEELEREQEIADAAILPEILPEPEPTPEPAPTASAAKYGTPVNDIRKAISVGDRFLFQRELFAQNGELMQKTLDAINKCGSFDDAIRYLDQSFDWDHESQAYQLFLTPIHRRFA